MGEETKDFHKIIYHTRMIKLKVYKLLPSKYYGWEKEMQHKESFFFFQLK